MNRKIALARDPDGHPPAAASVVVPEVADLLVAYLELLKTLAGIPPCIVEAAEKPEGTLFPTACGGVVYEGIAARPWLAASSDARAP